MLCSNRLLMALAFLVSLTVILGQIYANGPRNPEADELIYIEIAYDLNTYRTFSNSWSEEGRNLSDTPSPGRFFAPAYPIFLSALSKIDPRVGTFIACHAARGASCPGPPLTLVVAQAMLAAIQMACVFGIALALSGSPLVAGLALGLGLIFGQAAYYAQTYLTENIAFVGFYIFLAAGIAGLRHGRIWAFALAGFGLGVAIVSRPSYIYLYYILTPVLIVLALQKRNRLGLSWSHAIAFAGVGLAVFFPWMARNLAVFGDPALSAGYGAYILVQRVAYNAMSWAEWGVSFVYWLPDFGDNLSRALFAPELYARLGFEDPNSFYAVGNQALRQTTLAASGGPENHLSYLLRTYVLGDLFNHLMVTFPITLRGIWVGKYLALAGVLLLPATGLALYRAGRIIPFAFLVLALFFMAGLHGFVSVNVVRYNIPMIALYAFVTAYALVDLLRRVGWLAAAPDVAKPNQN